jgi:GT2 family glycosyltransferase
LEGSNIKNSVDVTIIIVNYKSYDLIINCIDSIKRETKDLNYELIIIDNCSSDNSAESLIARYDSVALIKNNNNRGFGAANNQGLEIAKGKYLLFLNNDTLLFENTVRKVFEFAETINKPVIVGCKLLNQDKTLQHSTFDFPTLMNVFSSNFFLYVIFPRLRYFNKYHLMNRRINTTAEVDTVTGAFLFCSKDIIQQIDGFDERFFFYNEETDLCYRVKQNGGEVYYYPETSIVHLKGGTAKTISWFAHKHQSESTIKFFQKHFSGLKYISALGFHYIGILIRIPIFLFIGIFTFNQNLWIRSYYYFKLLFIYPKNLFKDR